MSKPIMTIVTPYYNAEKYIEETAKSVLNQTFSRFEWIIVDDGSTKLSKQKLEELEKKDERIKVFYQENQGPAVARDFGIMQSSKSSKYVVFLDSDDLFEKTFLECCYWTLETHPNASWAYTDTINFGTRNFWWRKWYNPEWEKDENILTVLACVKKEDLLEVGGFGVKEKGVYEDWYLWLKLIKNGKYPVRMNSLLTYYRQKEKGSELKKANNKNRKRALKIIEEIKKEYFEGKDGIQFPKYDYNWEKIEDDIGIYEEPIKNNKINILMIIPWMVTGGADRFNLDLVSKMDKEKFEFTIITTLPSENEWRKEFEKYATIYDLTTFLEQKDWISFINYIIEKNSINLIFNSNSLFGYKILPYLKSRYPQIPIVDYVHMEEWYWRNGGFSRDSSALQKVIDKTYTCNENSREIFIKNFERKKSEVKTIYVGVDEKKFDPEKVKKERKDKKVISFIARIVEQKRPYLFFEVIKKLAKFRDDFIVIVAGDGPMLDGLKQKVKDNKLEKVFKFVGNIKDTEEIYAISDVTVNTSIKEGLALTSYESLAMGVPVVSADVGGQKELISEEVGIVVPCIQNETEVLDFNYTNKEIKGYVDAINKVLDNLDKYKSKCRARILRRFTIDKMVKNMEKEFEKIVQNPNKVKVQNGMELAKNQEVLKELITIYFEYSKPEYEWLANTFNAKNIHKKEKRKVNYEHTLEYKLKHPIVVILRKIGIYKEAKRLYDRCFEKSI